MTEQTPELMWPTKTFTYGPVTATVERQTVGHIILLNRIVNSLREPGDDSESAEHWRFAKIVSQTTAVEGMDVPFPDSGASADEWLTAYEWFQRMDANLFGTWWVALTDVDRPPSGVEFTPTHKLSAEERKNLRSAS